MSTRRPPARLALVLLALAALAPATAAAEVILHAFNWRYADVAQRAGEIAARGYGAVLVSPPLRSEGAAWWARYQPQDYRVIDNPLGDTEAFRDMVGRLGALGVATYADVVLNHMANEAAQRSDLDYPGRRVLEAYARDPARHARLALFGDLSQNLFGAEDFNEPRCITNYLDVRQVQAWRLCGGGGDPGLPDLADTARVVAAQRAYLGALRAIGVAGFRIDAAKHLTPAHVDRVFTPELVAGARVFGEIITGGGAGNAEHRLFLEPWLENTPHGAYDFPLHAALRRGFGFGGNLAELADAEARGQALPAGRAVTFTVTHDMPLNRGFRGQLLDPVDETLAYAFVLGRGAGAVLLYSDQNESGDNRWVDAWRREDLGAMIRFRNAFEGAPFAVLSAGSCHLLFLRGNAGLVGINKCATPVALRLKLPAALNARWDELLAGDDATLAGPAATLALPPRAARLWVRAKR